MECHAERETERDTQVTAVREPHMTTNSLMSLIIERVREQYWPHKRVCIGSGNT